MFELLLKTWGVLLLTGLTIVVWVLVYELVRTILD